MKNITDVKTEISSETNPLERINNFNKLETLLIFFPGLAPCDYDVVDDALVELFTSSIHSLGAYLLFFPDYLKATDVLDCVWQLKYTEYQSSLISNSVFNGRLLFMNGAPAAFTEFIPVGNTYMNVLLFPKSTHHPELPGVNTQLEIDEIKNRLLAS